jgi:hypothetical protein
MACAPHAFAGCGEACQALQAQLRAQHRAAVKQAIYVLIALLARLGAHII